MKHNIEISALLCLALLQLALATPASQDESGQPNNAIKSEKKKITLHIQLSAEGMDPLPTGSTIELKGDEETCKTNVQQTQHVELGEATFPDLPVCKVRLWIFITGFDTKTVPADLAKYKDPIRIVVKSNGPPVVN